MVLLSILMSLIPALTCIDATYILLYVATLQPAECSLSCSMLDGTDFTGALTGSQADDLCLLPSEEKARTLCTVSCTLTGATCPENEALALEGICARDRQNYSLQKQCVQRCLLTPDCEAYEVHDMHCGALFSLEGIYTSPITALEQCPATAPYAAVNGHYCCVNEMDESTGYECQNDLVPCSSPPCITQNKWRRAECPMEHPFHFDQGRHCCKHYQSKADAGCDGAKLGGESPQNCCQGDEFVYCPGLQCRDHNMAQKFCPAYIEDTMRHSRFNDIGYWLEDLSSLSVTQSKAACRAKGGQLMMFKESGVIDHIREFRVQEGIASPHIAFGLRGLDSQGWCANATCEGKLEWDDGVAFSWEAWMDEEISLGRPLSAGCFILDYPVIPAGPHQIQERYCTGAGHLTICEKSCLA